MLFYSIHKFECFQAFPAKLVSLNHTKRSTRYKHIATEARSQSKFCAHTFVIRYIYKYYTNLIIRKKMNNVRFCAFFPMAKITHLPDETITIILENESISIEDIISFKSTCKRLRQITLPNYFWKKKFCQRCSTATKYCAQKPKKTFNHLNFEEQIKIGIKCVKKLRYYVLLISDNNLSANDKIKLENFLLYIVRYSKLTYYFVLDEINRICSAQCYLSWSPDQHLTIKYNLELIANCLKQYRYTYNNLKVYYKPMIKLPLFERLITMIVQYLQPHISYSIIRMWLDNIAQEVLHRLRIKHPAHPIFSTSVEQLLFWKNNHINDHFWNPTETMQIMCVLEKYIFSELDVDKLLLSSLISDLEDKYVNCISEFFSKYLPIIIYHSVARRLGIYCILSQVSYCQSNRNVELIEIIWRLRDNTETWNNAVYFYIRKLSERKLIYPLNIVKGKYHKDDLPSVRRFNDNSWLFNITRNLTMLFNDELIHNCCINYKWKFDMISRILGRFGYSKCLFLEYLWLTSFYKSIINVIQIKSDVAIEKKLEERKEEIFTVGTIVTYRSQNLNFFNDSRSYNGVIIDWHDKYDCMFLRVLLTINNILRRGYIKLPYLGEYCSHCAYEEPPNRRLSIINRQPYYIILAENNTLCYVPQDRISICPPKQIDNIEIGRFFYRFQGTHYVPNKNLEEYILSK